MATHKTEKLVIEIETGNDAFGKTQWEEAHEVARILKGLTDEIGTEESARLDRTLRDSNGNAVGTVRFRAHRARP